MSAIAIKWVSEITVGNQTAKQLLSFLATHNFNTAGIFFKNETVARQLEISIRAVQKAYSLLLKKNLISKVARFDDVSGRQMTNEYHLNIPQEFVDNYFNEGEQDSSLGVNNVHGGGAYRAGGGSKKTSNSENKSKCYKKTPSSNKSFNSNINKTDKGAIKKTVSKLALPEWLDPDLWDTFVFYRKQIGKPLTRDSRELCLANLINLKNNGENINAVILKTIENGWRSFYPVDKKPVRGRK